jgi:hypothetical protein
MSPSPSKKGPSPILGWEIGPYYSLQQIPPGLEEGLALPTLKYSVEKESHLRGELSWRVAVEFANSFYYIANLTKFQ